MHLQSEEQRGERFWGRQKGGISTQAMQIRDMIIHFGVFNNNQRPSGEIRPKKESAEGRMHFYGLIIQNSWQLEANNEGDEEVQAWKTKGIRGHKYRMTNRLHHRLIFQPKQLRFRPNRPESLLKCQPFHGRVRTWAFWGGLSFILIVGVFTSDCD